MQVIEEYQSSLKEPIDKFLFADALLSAELERWLGSSVGRYLVGRAAEEVKDFVSWSLSAEAAQADIKEFQTQRSRAVAAQTLVQWAVEQINAGRMSERRLIEAEQA